MTSYAVEVTVNARAAILKQAKYIALEKEQPGNAERWLDSVWDAVDSLEQFPKRTHLADENKYRIYEVRQLAVGSQLLLLSIDDDRRKVWVIGLRGASQRPRPQDLPPNLEELEEKKSDGPP